MQISRIIPPSPRNVDKLAGQGRNSDLPFSPETITYISWTKMRDRDTMILF
jgi:hypothetical protein